MTNLEGYPEAVVLGITNDDYTRGECDFTATELLKPPRVRALQKKHGHEVVVDVADMVYAFEGKILHKILEKANRTGLIEKRFFATIEGRKVSAQIDTLAWDDNVPGLLSDWKRCSAFKLNKVDADWTLQLNTQAYILSENDIEVTGLQIVAFAKDHSKVMAATQKNYPKSAIARIPLPYWSKQETLDKIMERIERHEAAEKELPECSDDERWNRFNRSFGKIVPLRCRMYCEVNKFCDQYQKELKNEI